MRDSDRYMAQAQTVAGIAGRAGSPAERDVYENIAEGWRKLAAEARRSERRADRDADDQRLDAESAQRLNG